ncbi:MAG TPA: hypothetical protein VMH24_03790 [Candidatus Sulfotelmatobacter sp.]|nr:hypothetical protein [Candidatus Sulfotelmatobacter sp.]
MTAPDPGDVVPLPTLPPPAGRAARLSHLVRDALRLEDLVLIVWVGLQPVLFRLLGFSTASPSGGGLDLLDGHDPLLGLVALASVAGALVCLATRPATPTSDAAGQTAPRGLIGPLTGGLLLATVIGTQNLFGVAEAGFGVTFVAVVVASLLPGALPATPVAYRRVLVTPYVLLSASVFNGLIGQVGGLFDLHGVLGLGLGQTLQALPWAIGVMAVFAGVYYVMLVYAPRQLAVADGGTIAWLVRFLVFLAVEIAAASWLAATA